MCGVEQWQLVGPITRRPQVRILPPLQYSLEGFEENRDTGMKKKIIALDIGTTAVKVVDLETSAAGPILNQARIVAVPPGENEHIRIARELLAEFNAQQCALSIPGRYALIRSVPIPAVAATRAEATLKIEIQHRIPFPLEQVTWSSVRLPAKGATLDFLAGAVKKDVLGKVISPFYNLPEEILFIDVDPLVLLNLVTTLPDFQPTKTYAILDLGAESSNLVIFQENLVTVRSLTTNGNNFTEALKEEKNIETEEAEQAKLNLEENSLPTSITNTVENLIAEVQSSIDYWRFTQKGPEINQLYLTGGGALLAGLKTLVHDRLRITTRYLDPFAGIDIPPDKELPLETKHRLALACGLARRAQLGEKTFYRLNFLPAEYTSLQKARHNRIYVFLAAFLAIMVAFTPIFFYYHETQLKRSLVHQLNEDLEEYEQYLPRIQDLQRELNDLQGRFASLEGVLNMRDQWLSRVIAVGRILPSAETYLTGFTPTADETRVDLSGEIHGATLSLSFRDLRQLIINLNHHPFFQSATVTSVERVNNSLDFTITVNLR